MNFGWISQGQAEDPHQWISTRWPMTTIPRSSGKSGRTTRRSAKPPWTGSAKARARRAAKASKAKEKEAKAAKANAIGVMKMVITRKIARSSSSGRRTRMPRGSAKVCRRSSRDLAHPLQASRPRARRSASTGRTTLACSMMTSSLTARPSTRRRKPRTTWTSRRGGFGKLKPPGPLAPRRRPPGTASRCSRRTMRLSSTS